MSKRSSVPKEKPVKPLNGYMKFRVERLQQLAGQAGANKIVKEEWDNMPE